MAEGWIKLYRNIQEHWIWQDPQKLKWWLDILLLANHKDSKFLLGNELMQLERGEHHTSELKLSERWGVSKTTVRKFLNLLESDGMIELKKSKKGTTLKISNYNDYQDFSEGEKTIKKPQKNHEVDHKETIEEPYAIPQKNHKVYTNNNEKNDKNEKNDNKIILDDEKIKSIRSISDKWTSCGFGTLNKNLLDKLEVDIEIYTVEWVLEAIDIANERCKRSYSYVKAILENWNTRGKDYTPQKRQGKNKNSFCDYEQRKYDFNELERKLLGWDKEGE